MDVTIQSDKNVDISLTPQQPLTVQVTPVATQTIQINRGLVGPSGPPGPPGPNTIGGYPISVASPQNYDALMFRTPLGAWTNINQTEISDGGNF
jgi:hypothetical protein